MGLQSTAAQHGLILVDTKYEFGRDSSGNICLLDEVCGYRHAMQRMIL